jgi:catechol 2,3-dioxygenase
LRSGIDPGRCPSTGDVQVVGLAKAAAMNDYGIQPPEYRLPDPTHVGLVRLQVSDLARSLAFYTGVIGLRAIFASDGVARLAPVEDAAALIELHERQGVRPVPRRGRLGLYHIAILLPDRAALGRFFAHLAATDTPAGSADHLVSEALYLRDPDNLGIEVYADRPRSSWRADARELQMTTAPLDLRSLTAAGGNEPWAGTPAGTVIGHVHLHVGDLGRAEAFYHVALGLNKTVWSYPGALFLSAGGYHHHLGTNVWAAGAPPATPQDARLIDWELVLPSRGDADAAAGHVAAAGYEATPIGGHWRLTDPWGTGLRLGGRTPGDAGQTE